MSNRQIVHPVRAASKAIAIVFGLVVFLLSCQMLLFGWQWRVFDLAETDVETEKAVLAYSNTVLPWADRFGYRLMSRKIYSNSLLIEKQDRVSLDAIRTSVESVLTISPLEPAYWLLLGRISQLQFAPTQDLINHLRMSYLTGRSDYTVMQKRFELALSLWPELEETDKTIAVNDLIVGPYRVSEDLTPLLSGLSTPDLQDLREILKIRHLPLATKVDLVLQGRTDDNAVELRK